MKHHWQKQPDEVLVAVYKCKCCGQIIRAIKPDEHVLGILREIDTLEDDNG